MPAPPNEEFKPITSQDELNAVLKERLERARKAAIPADYDELKAKAAQFDELQEANRSDLEKATARADAAEAELQELRHAAELQTWREAASAATGVPAAVLMGDTEAEIMAHAEAIKAAIPIYPKIEEPGTPPPTMTRAEIFAIKNAAARQAAIAAHPELF